MVSTYGSLCCMCPDDLCIVIGVSYDLGCTCITNIIVFNQFLYAPGCTCRVTISPDIIATTIIVAPGRDGISSAVESDLWGFG